MEWLPLIHMKTIIPYKYITKEAKFIFKHFHNKHFCVAVKYLLQFRLFGKVCVFVNATEFSMWVLYWGGVCSQVAGYVPCQSAGSLLPSLALQCPLSLRTGWVRSVRMFSSHKNRVSFSQICRGSWDSSTEDLPVWSPLCKTILLDPACSPCLFYPSESNDSELVLAAGCNTVTAVLPHFPGLCKQSLSSYLVWECHALAAKPLIRHIDFLTLALDTQASPSL